MRRLALFGLLLVFPASLEAAFEDYLTGGRATGVDGAMTALADDAFALYYNPAAIAFLRGPDVGMTVGRLYGGLSDDSNLSRGFLGYAYPFHHQAIGVSYTTLNLSGLYKEEMVGLTYAWRLGDRFSVGLTAKNYRKTIGHDFNTDNAEQDGSTRLGVRDPVFQNRDNADAWGGDASVLYRLSGGWRTGLMVRNVNEPNVALGNAASDPVSRVWNWGIARQWNHHAVMLDVSRSRFTEMETRFHGGYETWWANGHLGMRAGGGYGGRDYRRITAGFSYRLSVIQFDYGYMMPFNTVEGTIGTHQVSLAFHLGRTAPMKALSMLPAYDQAQVMDLNEILADSPVPQTKLAAPWLGSKAMGITLTPTYASLKAGETQQFHADVTGVSDPRIFWTLLTPLGTLSRTGLYRAPGEILFPQNVWVMARYEMASRRMLYERVMIALKPSTSVTFLEILLEEDADWERVATILAEYPQTTAAIEAHTDDQGSPARNLDVSAKRAKDTRDRFVQEFGVASKRMTASGFGASRPVASNKTADGRRRNRRLAVIIRARAAPVEAAPEAE